MFPKLHLGKTDIFIYSEKKLTEHEVQALFQRHLHMPRVSHSHSREVEDNHSLLPVALEQLQLSHWGLRALLKGTLVEI